MTKAQRIRQLYDGKRTTREIAEIVGCRPEYVRVAARQREPRRGVHPVFPSSKILSAGDIVAARKAGRSAWAARRAMGSDIRDASAAYTRARYHTLRSTGLAALRKEAAHA